MLTTTGERLSTWTTLRLGGPARSFVEVAGRQDLFDAVAECDAAGEPVLVLGGGSNLVVGDDGFDGTVIHIVSKDSEPGGTACSGAEFTVEAGESWDEVVAKAVESQWLGIEALAGIPGTVGAVPIQNVGAYGQEVADTISQVHAYDRVERKTRTLFAWDCQFGYRTSLFKREPGRYVVGAVTFQFTLGDLGRPIRYGELARLLEVDVGDRVPSKAVRDAVLELRRSKGMVLDPLDHDTWSAGSFFTNPFVEPEALPDGAPAYPQADGLVKTSAAWLIERAGFHKGYGSGAASLSTKHTLAVTNRGRATTAELLDLAREVRDGVAGRFGIELTAEPTFVNCAL